MKKGTLKEIANNVAYFMAPKSNFTEGMDKVDVEKVIEKILRGHRLPKKEKDFRDFKDSIVIIIRLLIDDSISKVRIVVTDVVQSELKEVKADIKDIKSEVGLNGKDTTG